MSYVRLTGRNGAFGWQREGRIALGGLRPRQTYGLLFDGGKSEFQADTQGAWSGKAAGEVLGVGRGGQAILWNENRVHQAGAQALLNIRPEPAPQTPPPPPPSPEKPKEKAIPYRRTADTPPVDALPTLQWPQAAAQLRPYFDTLRPVGLFPGWRTVKTREAGMPCCFGFHIQGDRVDGLLYGVQARGSMLPPKGLQGYSYERAADGQGYWVLRQTGL